MAVTVTHIQSTKANQTISLFMHQNDDRLNRICQLIYTYNHDYGYHIDHLCGETQENCSTNKSQNRQSEANVITIIQLNKSIENW